MAQGSRVITAVAQVAAVVGVQFLPQELCMLQVQPRKEKREREGGKEERKKPW